MKLLGATATDAGNVRETNQDRVYFADPTAALADGMGGHQGGERAAELAIGQFQALQHGPSEDQLVEVVLAANRAVFGHASENGMPGMGTTLVALTLHGDDTITVANVGDSRAYWIRGDYMKQITDDHSFVEDLVRQGRLTPEEAATHPQRNILTRAVGIGIEVDVDRFPIDRPEVGDRFLLCSDGLFNELPEDEILAIILSAGGPLEAAEALVDAALQTPCRDNVTVAVVEAVEDDDPRLAAAAAARAELEDDDPGAGIITTEYPESDQVLPAPPPIRSDGNSSGPDGAESASAAPVATMTLAPDTEPDRDDLSVEAEPVKAEPLLAPLEQIEPRGRLAMALGTVLLLGALAIATYLGARFWATSGYHLAADDAGNLAVFEGRDGGLFGLFDADEPVRTSAFPASAVDDLGLGPALDDCCSSLEEAESFLVEVDQRLNEPQGSTGAGAEGSTSPSDGTADQPEPSPSDTTEFDESSTGDGG